MAHNGGFGEVAQLEKELGSYARMVLGDTDSERFFALITKETDAHGGDVGARITAGPAGSPRGSGLGAEHHRRDAR